MRKSKAKLQEYKQNSPTAKHKEPEAINDDNWQCFVVMLIENDISQVEITSLFKEIANVGVRPAIKLIINDSGFQKQSAKSKSRSKSKSPKTNKTQSGDKSLSNIDPQQEAAELKASVDLIKSHIFKLKESDIQNRKKKEQDKLNIIKETVDESKTISNKTKKKSTKSSKQNKKELTVSYISDEPKDGPNLYIVLCGFYNPWLPCEIIKAGVPLRGVIKYGTAVTQRRTSRISEYASKQEKTKQNIASEIRNFFDNFESYTRTFSEQSHLISKDMAVFSLIPSDSLNLTVKKSDRQLIIYDQISFFLYELQEYWNYYNSYMNELKLHDIKYEEFSLDDAVVYRNMINMIPLESTTVEIILHCMLEEVIWRNPGNCNRNSQKNNYDEQSQYNSHDEQSQNNSHDEQSQNNSHNEQSQNNSHDEQSQNRNDNKNPQCTTSLGENFGDKQMYNITPNIIHHNDKIHKKTFHLHLADFNFSKIIHNVLITNPVFQLWNLYPVQTDVQKAWFAYHSDILRQASENFYYNSTYIFFIYLHQVLLGRMKELQISTQPETNIFNKIQEKQLLDSQLKNNSAKQLNINQISSDNKEQTEDINPFKLNSQKYPDNYANILNQFYNDPDFIQLKSKDTDIKQQLKHIKSFLECNEITNMYNDASIFKTDIMKNYQYIEKLNSTELTQVIQNAFSKYLYINYEYLPLTDSILLWFNNGEDESNISQKISSGSLQTTLNFQDFYTFILSKNKYLKKNIERRSASDNNDDGDNINKNNNYIGSNNTENNNLESCIDEDNASSTRMNSAEPEVYKSNTNLKYETIGYDFGLHRIQTNETQTSFFSNDGSNVQVRISEWVHNIPKTLYIEINKLKNRLIFHTELTGETINDFSLQFTLFNDILITANTHCASIQRNEDNLEGLEKSFVNFDLVNEMLLQFNLNIVLPTGLRINLVTHKSDSEILYVRQQYTSRGPLCSNIWDETCRCYLKNGIILIFRTDDSVDILYNNGTIVKCKNITFLEQTQVENKVKAVISNEIKRKSQSLNKEKISKSKRKSAAKLSTSDKKLKIKQTKKIKENVSPISERPRHSVNNNFSEDSSTKTQLININKFSIIKHTGEYVEFIDGKKTHEELKFKLRTAYDIFEDELYILRSDGTSTLFTPHYVTVNYPDGTRITNETVMIIDADDITVSDKSDSNYMHRGDVNITHFLTVPNLGSNERGTTESDSNYPEVMIRKESPNVSLVDVDKESLQTRHNTVSKHKEPFEIVGINSCMEHSSYARVEFNEKRKEVIISLPDNITITTENGKTYSIQVGEKTTIQLSQNNVMFDSKLNYILQNNSTRLNFYKYKDNKGEPTFICRTTDIFGNSFIFDDKSVLSNSFKHVKGSFNYKDYLENNLYSKERFFVMKRDFTGYEMLKIFSDFLDTSSSSQLKHRSSTITEHQNGNKELCNIYIQTQLAGTLSDKYLMEFKYNHLPTNLKKMHLSKLSDKNYTMWFDKTIKYKDVLTHNESKVKFIFVKKNYNFIIRNIKKIKSDKLNVTDAFQMVFYKYFENYLIEYNKYVKNIIIDTRTIEEKLASMRLSMNILKNAMPYWTEEQNQLHHTTSLITNNPEFLNIEPAPFDYKGIIKVIKSLPSHVAKQVLTDCGSLCYLFPDKLLSGNINDTESSEKLINYLEY